MGLINRLFGKKTSKSDPSPAEFAEMLMGRVRAAGETRELTYDPERSVVMVEGGPMASLGNLYPEYLAAGPEQRDLILESTARLFFMEEKELPGSFAEARADLMPIVRSRFQEQASRLQMQAASGDDRLKHWPSEGIGDHMALGVAYDFPEGIQLINQGQLEEWNVTFEEALEAARHNLAAVEVEVGTAGNSLYIPMAGDTYDSARLILLDMIRGFDLEGDPVALVLNRETLMIAGADDEEGLRIMAEYAKQHLEDARPVCWIPVRLDGGAWHSWLPPEEHPSYGEFRLLQIQHLGSEYGEQQDLLNNLHERKGIDVFVGSYSAIKTDTGELTTYSVWPKDVLAWLPRVDQLALMESKSAQPDLLPWDAVADRVGHLMEPLGLYPERFKVESFPSNEDLEHLRGLR